MLPRLVRVPAQREDPGDDQREEVGLKRCTELTDRRATTRGLVSDTPGGARGLECRRVGAGMLATGHPASRHLHRLKRGCGPSLLCSAKRDTVGGLRARGGRSIGQECWGAADGSVQFRVRAGG
eukprot:scaffold792_cov60-Phaeocystis_antarctica.AAC.2